VGPIMGFMFPHVGLRRLARSRRPEPDAARGIRRPPGASWIGGGGIDARPDVDATPGRRSNARRASSGGRTPRGPERAPFREGPSSLRGLAEDSPDDEDDGLYDVGVAAFDRLRKRRKRAPPTRAGGALKRREAPHPESTAPPVRGRRSRPRMRRRGGRPPGRPGRRGWSPPHRRLVRRPRGLGGDRRPPGGPHPPGQRLRGGGRVPRRGPRHPPRDDAEPEDRGRLLHFTAVAPDPRESEADRIKAALMRICGRLDAASGPSRPSPAG